MESNRSADQTQAQSQLSRQGPASSAVDGEHRRGWDRLDAGVLPLIASRLQKQLLGAARLACRQWAAELPRGCTRLSVSGKGPDGWEHLFCGLKELTWMSPETGVQFRLPAKLWSLCLVDFSDGDLRILGALPGLTSLRLGGRRKITDLGVKEIGRMSSLTFLDLSCVRDIETEGLRRVTMDDMKTPDITDAVLKKLNHMSNLTSLGISYCAEITDEGLKELGHMSKLTSLNLSSCYRITDAGLKELDCHAPNLTSLDMSYCVQVTDVGLKGLRHMSKLTYLDLSCCFGITDGGLMKEHGNKNYSSLRSLNLGRTVPMFKDDERMKELTDMPNLARLTMDG